MAEYIYFVHPSRSSFPGDGTPEEFAVISEHFEYLKAMLALGELILVGRTMDVPPVGIAIFEAADDEAARLVLDRDPAVANGIFRGEVRPYKVALMRGRD
jgi:uncharacterized protein YciI